MRTSCKKGCRHLQLGYDGYGETFKCGRKLKTMCLKGGFNLWEPNVKLVLKQEKERIYDILRLNSILITTTSKRQKEVYETKKQLLLNKLNKNVLYGEFTDPHRAFSEYSFGVDKYFVPLYEKGRYSTFMEEIGGVFCTECNDCDIFNDLIPAINVKSKRGYSHNMTDRGGLTARWVENTYRCPKCNKTATIDDNYNEESDDCDLGTRAAGYGT